MKLSGITPRVEAVAFSPDGQQLASGGWDAMVRVWAGDGSRQESYKGHRSWVTTVTWQPNGKSFASGGIDDTVRVWNQDGATNAMLRLDDEVVAAAWSSAGSRIAAAGKDRTIRLWNPNDTSKPILLKGHETGVNALDWSHDGEQLASGCADGSIRLWNADGTTGSVLEGHNSDVMGVAWRPDGATLASVEAGGSGTLRIWSADGTPIRAFNTGGNGYSVAWKPDGNRLVTATSELVRIWEPDGTPGPTLHAHRSYVTSVDWSSNGRQLASGSTDGTIIAWDAEKEQPEWVGVPLNDGQAAAFTAAGQLLYGDPELIEKEFVYVIETDDGKLELLSHSEFLKRFGSVPATTDTSNTPATPQPTKPHLEIEPDSVGINAGKPLSGAALVTSPSKIDGLKSWTIETIRPRGEVRTVSFNPAGNLLATAGKDCVVRLWDSRATRLQQTLVAHFQEVLWLDWAPNGEYLASTGDDGTIKIWHVDSGALVRTLRPGVSIINSVCWSPDGKMLVSGSADTFVRLWDVPTGQVLSTLKGHTDFVWNVAWSPDGGVVASGGRDGTIRIWDPETWRPIKTLKDHQAEVHTIAFSPDGKILASTSYDGTVRLWDVAKEECIHSFAGGSHQAGLAWSPDGKSLASLMYGGGESDADPVGVQVWDLESKQLSYTFAAGIFGRDLSWSPNGELMAVTTRYNSNSEVVPVVWDCIEKRPVSDWTAHDVYNRQAAVSPDGKLIAVCTSQAITIWDIANGQIVQTILTTQGYFDWSPNSRELVTEGRVIWDVETGRRVRSLRGRSGSPRAWSPDGKWIAGRSGNAIYLWNAQSGKLLHEVELEGNLHEILWSNDSQVVAVFGDNNKAYVINVTTGKAQNEGEDESITWKSIESDPRFQHKPIHHLQAKRVTEAGLIRLTDRNTGETMGTFVTLDHGRGLAIAPSGHYRGSPRVEKEIVYVALTEDGSQQTFTPDEFAEKYGWKNDPDKVQLLPAAE